MSAMALLDRETAKLGAQTHAATILVFWFRRRKGGGKPPEASSFSLGCLWRFFNPFVVYNQGSVSAMQRKKNFKKAVTSSKVDVNACQSDVVRLEQAVARSQYIAEAMTYLLAKAKRLQLSLEATAFFDSVKNLKSPRAKSPGSKAKRSSESPPPRTASPLKSLRRRSSEQSAGEVKRLISAEGKMSSNLQRHDYDARERGGTSGPLDVETHQEFAETVEHVVLDEFHPKLKWRRSRDAVDRGMFRCRCV
jgi:hypothetical protein